MLRPAFENADFAAREKREEAAENADARDERPDAIDPPVPRDAARRPKLPSSFGRQGAPNRRPNLRAEARSRSGSGNGASLGVASMAKGPSETSLASALMTPCSICGGKKTLDPAVSTDSVPFASLGDGL